MNIKKSKTKRNLLKQKSFKVAVWMLILFSSASGQNNAKTNTCFRLGPTYYFNPSMELHGDLDSASQNLFLEKAMGTVVDDETDSSFLNLINTCFQMQISIDHNCFNSGIFLNAKSPLINEIPMTAYASPVSFLPGLHFDSLFYKSISGLGECKISRYSYKPDEASPNLFLVIIPENKIHGYFDIQGIILFGYGFNWYKDSTQNGDNISIIYNVRRNKRVEVLMHFKTPINPDNNNDFFLGSFIPISHRRMPGWGE